MYSIFAYLQKLKAEVFFGVFSAIFGVLILFITPPFQVPDEINHFYRAYQIADGHFTAEKQDNRIGGNLPLSIINCTKPFDRIFWNVHTTTNYQTIVEQFKSPLRKDKTVFVDFPNTGVYSPVSYLPQSSIIYILKSLNLPALYLFYGARLMTLLLWIICIYYTIRIIPFYKWLVTLIALLPMSLYINMSISADVVTNILSYLLIAYILNLAFIPKKINFKKFSVVVVLILLLASAKLVYAPIIALYLLIPQANFSSSKQQYIQTFSLFLLTFVTILFWSKIMGESYIPYKFYNTDVRDHITIVSCADIHEQLKYILSHGTYIIEVFYNSMISSFDMYYEGCIGTFGWLETKLPIWLIHFSYVVLIIIALNEKHSTIILKPLHKLIIAIIFSSVLTLILLSQHLIWDCVGGDIISNIQGRYFIPVFPLLFFLFNSSKIKIISNIQILVIVFTTLSLSITIYTIYTRYYISKTPVPTSINCDAELISENKYFITNTNGIVLENANTQTAEKSRSGKHSIKLSSAKPYGFTYRLYNCNYGDRIQAKIWRLGNEGSLIITGENNVFSVGESKSKQKDSLGWELVELNYTIPKNMVNKETIIFVFQPGADSIYFDDLSIVHTKYE